MPLRPPITMPKTDREFGTWCRDTGDTRLISGAGSPEGVYTANRGTIFLRTDGAGEVYRKTTDGVNTGWVAM